ncbi:MAG: [ribosomal protein S18]-alanine N-acetyltransferase [Thermoplasmata archaeon]|jgi:ribosomal-protein-alanine N-acetyltransferase|nr:[ribosomal protein S18]-alanine N-acetyltransferase [Thermoplasmata archaeon]
MLVVEPMKNGDADPVARLAARTLTESYDPAWLAGHAHGGSTCLVARDVPTNRVVGFAVAANESCECHLLAIAVDQQFRGAGIGSALLRNVRQEMTRAGAMRMKLEVRAEDQATQQFYTRHGFAPDGLESHVYSDGGDAIRMTRPL